MFGITSAVSLLNSAQFVILAFVLLSGVVCSAHVHLLASGATRLFS